MTLICILFKISSVIICRHNQLKRLSWTDFSCMFDVDLSSLIHNASAIFRFRLLLWTFLLIISKSVVLTILCDFPMLCFGTYIVCSLPLWSLILSVIRRGLSPTWSMLVRDISYDKLNHGYVQSQFCLWHWQKCSV